MINLILIFFSLILIILILKKIPQTDKNSEIFNLSLTALGNQTNQNESLQNFILLLSLCFLLINGILDLKKM